MSNSQSNIFNAKKESWMQRREIFAIFKLFFFVFVSDTSVIFAVLVLPVIISVIWIILMESQIIKGGVPNALVPSDPLKQWYEFLLFLISYVALFYIASKFNEFRKTILFRRILIGGINKWLLFFLLIMFYWIIITFVGAVKFSLLFYYQNFRSQIKKVDAFFLLVGFFLFILTNITIAIFISSLPISITIINIFNFFLIFLMFILAGSYIDIEMFFLDQKKVLDKLPSEAPENFNSKYYSQLLWSEVNYSSQVWRYITFVSPYQPSLNIIKNAHLNSDWKIPFAVGHGSTDALSWRPMIYSNYWFPILINFGWITFFLSLSGFMLRKNY